MIKEGKLESNIAENIAEQVRKRLSTTKINYLTAPLMREYINGILLENDLEEEILKKPEVGHQDAKDTKMGDDESGMQEGRK